MTAVERTSSDAVLFYRNLPIIQVLYYSVGLAKSPAFSFQELTQCRCGRRPSARLSQHRLYPGLPLLNRSPSHFPTMSTSKSNDTSIIETSKRNAAYQAVKDHFDPSATYVGIGSGSTIVYVVEAIKALDDPRIRAINFIPTGYQSREVIKGVGLNAKEYDSFDANTLIDVAFDGADEIDDDLNCIKGGGACLYQEKLVAKRAKKFICVAGTYVWPY